MHPEAETGSRSPGQSGPLGGDYPGRLPVTTGTFAMWLFLSSEVMLVVALLAVWMVLRSSAGPRWPTLAAMHVDWWRGAGLTAVLVASAWTAWRAAERARAGKSGPARGWIAATLLLGAGFIALKGEELYRKWQLGLVRLDGRDAIRDEADGLYVSLLAGVLRDQTSSRSGDSAGPGEGGTAGTVETLRHGDADLALEGLVAWTARECGRSSDARRRRQLMQSLADLVMPSSGAESSREFLVAEQTVLEASRQELRERQSSDQERLAILQRQMTESGGSAEAGGVDPSLRREAAAVTAGLTETRQRLGELESRLAALERFLPMADRGINRELGLRLPVVIEGGPVWWSGHLLLVGMHAIHMLGGMLVWTVLLVARGERWLAAAIGNAALYWQLVDLFWLAVFLFVYVLN